MARLKDRLMDARLARSLAILIIVTIALYALTAVAFHHLFATQIGEVRNLATASKDSTSTAGRLSGQVPYSRV